MDDVNKQLYVYLGLSNNSEGLYRGILNWSAHRSLHRPRPVALCNPWLLEALQCTMIRALVLLRFAPY